MGHSSTQAGRSVFGSVSDTQFRLALIGAMVLQCIILGLFYFNVIRDPFHQPNSFVFHQGGDQDEFFSLARSIIYGTPERSRLTLGYPFLMIPFMVVLNPTRTIELTPIIALVHAFIFFPLAQIILAKLAIRLTHRRGIAVMSVYLWTAMPLFLYLALTLIGKAELGAIWAVHLPWPQMLSDPPATFLTLLAFWLIFIQLESTGSRSRLLWSVALGVVTGLAFIVRVNTILTTLLIVAVLVLRRRPQPIVVLGVTGFLIFIPQLIYNIQQFGNPLTMGYQTDTYDLPPQGLFNVRYLVDALGSGYGWLLIIGAIGLCVFLVLTGFILSRWERISGWLVPLWVLLYVGFFSVYYYSWTGGWTRFLLPAYPALAILVATMIWSIWSQWAGRSSRRVQGHSQSEGGTG